MEFFAREEAQRILSKEKNTRKHIRQLQVRQQFQCWSEEQRRKVQVEKKHQIQKLKAKMAEKEEKLAIEKIQKLLLMHELTLNSIGEAHRAAAQMPNFQQIRIEKELFNLSKAKARGRDALRREKLICEEQKRPMMVAKEIKESVRMYEDLKAKDLVEKRPFRPRNNAFDMKSGKDHVFAYNEHLSNLLNAPVGQQKKDKPIKSILKKNTSIKTPPSIKDTDSSKKISVFAQVARDPQNHPKISFNYPDQSSSSGYKSKKKKRDKINYVSFYDDSLPNVPELAREPKGLFRRHKNVEPGELNAWEEALLVSEEMEKKQLEEFRKSEERQKIAEERGKKALALAKLESRLNEYIASLNDDDALKLKADLIQDDSFTEDEIEELFKRSRNKSILLEESPSKTKTPMLSLYPPRPKAAINSSSSSSLGSLTPPQLSQFSPRFSFKRDREENENENEFDELDNFDESTVIDHSRLPSPSKSLKRTPFKDLELDQDNDDIMEYLSHSQVVPPFTQKTTPLHQEKLTLSDLDDLQESSIIQSKSAGKSKSKRDSRKSFREYLLDKNFNESFQNQNDKSTSTISSSSVLSAEKSIENDKNKNNLSSSPSTSTTDYLDLSSPTIFRLRLCETSNSLDTPTSDKSASTGQNENEYYPETSTPFSATKVGHESSSSGIIKPKSNVRTHPKLDKYIKKLLTMRPESVQGLSGGSSCDSSSLLRGGPRSHISLSTTCGSEDLNFNRIGQDSPSSITITSSSDTTTTTTSTNTSSSSSNDTINQVQFTISRNNKDTKSQSRLQVIEFGSEKSKSRPKEAEFGSEKSKSRPQAIEFSSEKPKSRPQVSEFSSEKPKSRPQVIEYGSEKSKSKSDSNSNSNSSNISSKSKSSKNSSISKEFLRGDIQSNPSILDPIEKISNSIHSLTSSADYNYDNKTKDSRGGEGEESAESIFREIIEGFNSVTIELPSWFLLIWQTDLIPARANRIQDKK